MTATPRAKYVQIITYRGEYRCDLTPWPGPATRPLGHPQGRHGRTNDLDRFCRFFYRPRAMSLRRRTFGFLALIALVLLSVPSLTWRLSTSSAQSPIATEGVLVLHS